MKKIVAIALAVVLIAACNSADKTSAEREKYIKDSTAKANRQNGTAGTTNVNPQTDIQWLDSTYLDLGKVKKGQMVEVAFRFKNNGTSPLIIDNVSASCGCTVPEKPEKPYSPGEEGVIKAKFDSKNQHTGEHRKHVTVTANTNPNVHDLNFRVEVIE
jgi:hypothetical protein